MGRISPHDQFFSTDAVCGVCDKYQVCLWRAHNPNLTIRLPSRLIIFHRPYHYLYHVGGGGVDNDDEHQQQLHHHHHQHPHHLEQLQPV